MIDPSYFTYGETRYVPEVVTPPALGVDRWQFGEDDYIFGGLRSCAAAGCPAVMVLNDQPDIAFDKQWQFFLYAINPGMSVNAISALMGDAKALMNSTEGNGRNYITGENADRKPPNLDKLRTFARNIHTGVEVQEWLEVKTFDGNNPPPLHPGYEYPQTLREVDIDAYLITPQSNPEMFLVCSNVKSKLGDESSISPFPNGARYVWADEYYGTVGEMYSFFPLVSRYRILSPLWKWHKLQPGEKASPYRRV